MSSVLHPVGPEDKGTYWRRRLVVVLALVVVIVLVALGVRALTTSDDAAAQGPTKLDPSTVATTDAQTPTGSPSGSPSGTSATDTTASTATTGATDTAGATACSEQSLAATLRTDATAYGPGKTPKIVLEVENTSQTPCTLETSSAVRVVTITAAGGAQVWSNADCQSKGETATDVVAPGEKLTKTTTWSRQRSAAGCPTGQTAVDPGSYTASATWDGVVATQVTFTLAG
ncbi:hypothetical protein AB1207_04975 [Kineococcus endophyticus]|uniref:DUF4232 domain-containing protein n=1 Tax=Kineococcus endophyticus TaxID=1181883 RepID=A0ABV3P387_9ACTN